MEPAASEITFSMLTQAQLDSIASFIDWWILCISIVALVLFIRYTLNPRWVGVGDNPYKNETLGLPRGSLRGILTLSLLVIVLKLEAGGLTGKAVVVGEQVILPEDTYKELLVAFQMMLAFYFGSKVVHHVTSADKRKTESISNSIAQGRSAAAPAAGGGASSSDFDRPEAQG